MKKNKQTSDVHSWRFFRAGGFDQVRLDTANDLLNLEKLDQKLWVALACPVDNVQFDTRTLQHIDTDNDRRVRAPELIAAIKWTASLIKNPDSLLSSSETLPLQSINDATEEGKLVAAAARNALTALGKPSADAISVTDTNALEKVLSEKPFNGDGIVTEDSTQDEKVKALIRDIIKIMGSVGDRSGKPGVDQERIDMFFSRAVACDTWQKEVEQTKTLRPLGDATNDAAQAVLAVKDKISDYFTRCAIAEFDDRAGGFLNAGEKEYSAFGLKPLSFQSSQVGDLPIARIEQGRPLPLARNINPAWIHQIRQFEALAVRPLLGAKDSLSSNEWQSVLTSFGPWLEWYGKKPADNLDALGINRIREILAGKHREELLALVERDKAEAPTFASLVNLEKLVRCHRDLYNLCINFVNFKEFYSTGGTAIFQVGTLYLDQRSCRLCIKVDDAGRHSQMAAMAGTYLVYCDCRRRAGTDKMTIVAAFTNGDSDNIIIGRNGVFYDRKGNDWDATIIKIIENPISLRQAFWMPYKSLVRMIESQVAKRAQAADSQSTAKLEGAASATANVDKGKPPEPPKKLDIGIVAALGVAAGALGTFVATLMGYGAGIIKLGPLAIIAAFAGLLLLISGPSLILAYIKLRKRNLGPILDASGWAVNAKACINVPFGTVLTHTATLPAGSQRDLVDPYAEKKSPWPKIIILALLIYIVYASLDHFGLINEWSRGLIGKKQNHAAKAPDPVDKKAMETPPTPVPQP